MSLVIDRVCKSDSRPEKLETDGFVLFVGEPTPPKPKKKSVTPSPALYVPEGFDPDQHLERSRRNCGDRARYLLHMIHTQTIFNHRDRQDGVRLKAAYLRKFMTKKNYRHIIADLEAGGVIEIERKAIRGSQSYKFRLAGDFRTQSCRRYFPKDGYLVRALQKWRSDADREITCPTRKNLREQLWRVRVKFEDARTLLAGLPLNDEGHADTLSCLERLHEEDWYFVADRQGRVHHNVSCLKRELRQFLRVDGEPLVELDISNSQPLFCGLTYFIWLKNGCSFADLHSSDPLSGALRLNEEHLELLIATRSYLSSTKKQKEGKGKGIPLRCPPLGIVNNDAMRYLVLCEQGQLYEYLAEKAGEDLSDYATRNKFKQKVFSHVMFARKKHMDNSLAQVFKQEFPSIYELVMDAKHKDKSRLAGWMQQVESDLVIDRVVKRFIEERPNAFILTIHDSVLTKKRDAKFVRKLFQQEFGRFRVSPKLNVK